MPCNLGSEQEIVLSSARTDVVNDERPTGAFGFVRRNNPDMRDTAGQLPGHQISAPEVLGFIADWKGPTLAGKIDAQVRDAAVIDIGVCGSEPPDFRISVKRP